MPRKHDEAEFRRREDALLTAALRCAGTAGWRRTSVAEIAAAADVAKGTVYKHFASKEDLYARLAVDLFSSIVARLRTIDPALPGPARADAVVTAVWEELAAAPDYRPILFASQERGFRLQLSRPAAERLQAAETELTRRLGEILGLGPGAAMAAESALLGAGLLAWERDGDGDGSGGALRREAVAALIARALDSGAGVQGSVRSA